MPAVQSQTLEAAIRDIAAADRIVRGVRPGLNQPPCRVPMTSPGTSTVSSRSQPPSALPACLPRCRVSKPRAAACGPIANAPRPLDLDIISYRNLVNIGPNPPLLPHPRMKDRAFVLLPLQAIAPDWRHPVTGLTISALIQNLAGRQEIRLV